MKRQAVVNAGLSLVLRDESGSEKTEETFCYQNGIVDYVEEIAGLDAITPVRFIESSATGRDREDQPDYKVKMSAAFCFSNTAGWSMAAAPTVRCARRL